ncbi:MAG TPA: 2Fe-2S iron-sulfur cluster-binding protein [Stellaceae bacterium]|nr:2Fe-2S iron-sulfur cluster-binding protein [Stellaceae bacterium]
MTFQVFIRQHGAAIAVEPGATILESALAQGVPYPHGCRSGNCGACKSSLETGDVELAPHSEFALTPEERAQGLILGCRAVPWSDASVAWLGTDEVAAHPLRRLQGRVIALDDLTHDIKGVRIEITAGAPFLFSAGQYAALRFADLPPRDYSMANDPEDPILEFHIRQVGDGVSSRYAAELLASGEMVALEGPFGSSWLRERHAGPILALAGGSGLAPIKSIVEAALRRGMGQPIHLYFGVRDERDLYLEAHFHVLAQRHPNLRFVPVLSEPGTPTSRRRGFVHEAALADLPDLDGFKAYVAGPPIMVESATPLLLARGVRRQDIHADAFYTEAEKQAQTAGALA